MAQVKMPPEKWAKMISPETPIDNEEELEAVNTVLGRLRELTAILIFRLSSSHSQSVGIVREYRADLMKDVGKIWDTLGVRKYGFVEDGDDD